MIQKRNAREAAIKALSILHNAGFIAYLAGGCVRDRLLGRDPKDYDIATNARPDQVAGLFHKTMKVGEAFGVMLVRLAGHQIEVATFRIDGDYSDGRRPDSVVYATAEEDAKRRDFTINGLFENPLDASGQELAEPEVIDFVGGREDLSNGLIRAIGDPVRRFEEDYLRMLRAVRFTSRYQFELEEKTAKAIEANVFKIERIATERVGQELRLMLSHPDVKARTMAVSLMESLGLIYAITPGLKGQTYFEGRRSDYGVTKNLHVDAPDFGLSMAAWMLEAHVEMLGDNRQRGYLQSEAWLGRWEALAESFKRILCFSNDESVTFERAICLLSQTLSWAQFDKAGKKRLLANAHWQMHWELMRAVEKATEKEWAVFASIREELDQLLNEGVAPQPLIGGHHLIQLGLRPGPDFKKLLDKIYDAQLRMEIADEVAGLALAEKLVASG